jgi:hypothetical protein
VAIFKQNDLKKEKKNVIKEGHNNKIRNKKSFLFVRFSPLFG